MAHVVKAFCLAHGPPATYGPWKQPSPPLLPQGYVPLSAGTPLLTPSLTQSWVQKMSPFVSLGMLTE